MPLRRRNSSARLASILMIGLAGCALGAGDEMDQMGSGPGGKGDLVDPETGEVTKVYAEDIALGPGESRDLEFLAYGDVHVDFEPKLQEGRVGISARTDLWSEYNEGAFELPQDRIRLDVPAVGLRASLVRPFTVTVTNLDSGAVLLGRLGVVAPKDDPREGHDPACEEAEPGDAWCDGDVAHRCERPRYQTSLYLADVEQKCSYPGVPGACEDGRCVCTEPGDYCVAIDGVEWLVACEEDGSQVERVCADSWLEGLTTDVRLVWRCLNACGL